MDALNGLALDPTAMQAERKRAKHAKKKKAKARSAAVAAAEAAAAASEVAGLQGGPRDHRQVDSDSDSATDDDDGEQDEAAAAAAGGGWLAGVTVTSFREVLERQGATLPGRIREWPHTPVRLFAELAGMTVGTAAGLTAGFAAGCQRHIVAAKQAVTDATAVDAGTDAAGPGGQPSAGDRRDGQAAAVTAAEATADAGTGTATGPAPEPTPIQSAAWGVLLDADPPDLIAVSATGSGKTLAFLVPMIARTGAVAAQAAVIDSVEDAEARRLRARAAATVTLKVRLKEGRCRNRSPQPRRNSLTHARSTSAPHPLHIRSTSAPHTLHFRSARARSRCRSRCPSIGTACSVAFETTSYF